MFCISDIHNSNNCVKRIEESILKKHIKHYEFKHFYNVEKIGNGNSGVIYRSKWKNSEQYMILKSFYNFDNDATVKEIIREVIIKVIIYIKYTLNIHIKYTLNTH
jgi:hypothetical protein